MTCVGGQSTDRCVATKFFRIVPDGFHVLWDEIPHGLLQELRACYKRKLVDFELKVFREVLLVGSLVYPCSNFPDC